MSKKLIVVAAALVSGAASVTAQAAILNPGDLLSIGAGSWFAVDMDGNRAIIEAESVSIAPGSSGAIVIGVTQAVGVIDAWSWLEASGGHYTTVMPLGGTTTGIDFSGWSIFWGGAPVSVVVDYGAWNPVNCDTLGCTGVSFTDNIAAFAWSGVYGDSYSLWYSWSFQNYDPGCFCSTDYLLHLEGVVTAAAVTPVPLPPAIGLFASGLMLLLHKRARIA